MKPITEEQLFNFPCEFPIKAIGKDINNFEEQVTALIQKHIPNIHPKQIKSKLSSSKTFLSVTITILATSKKQLDDIYTDLNKDTNVLYTL
ncbi:Proposed lipoate regulatory protein YbeD [hydrothermal vent metagenome]|uniref:Proposed lipoate regulatory protein YbeD n=1 Tax=hydrothermal vent metagenome TaxID=652676 RepID=A0A1W1CDJ5_9ZZZZ